MLDRRPGNRKGLGILAGRTHEERLHDYLLFAFFVRNHDRFGSLHVLDEIAFFADVGVLAVRRGVHAGCDGYAGKSSVLLGVPD